MKRAFLVTLAVAALCICQAAEANKTNSEEERTMSIQKTYQFIKDAKTYYLATVEKDQPRVRPFGTIHIFEGKLYIQTGTAASSQWQGGNLRLQGRQVDPRFRRACR